MFTIIGGAVGERKLKQFSALARIRTPDLRIDSLTR